MGAVRTVRSRQGTRRSGPNRPRSAGSPVGNRATTARLTDDGPAGHDDVLSLQRTAGNAAASAFVQRKQSRAERKRTETRRSRAAKLGVPEARDFLSHQLPYLAPRLSDEQVAHIQTVMDAWAVNPALKKEHEQADARATRSYGSISVRDERLGAKADEIGATIVELNESMRHVRLDVTQLLGDDVYKPKLADIDEVNYLAALERRLDGDGVWLQIHPKIHPGGEGGISMTETDFGLTLGPEGYGIPTETGLIDRKAIEGCVPLGAMYYRMVLESPRIQVAERERDRLFQQLLDGQQEHLEEDGRQDTAFPGVVSISEWLGDAPDYPSSGVWQQMFSYFFQGGQLLSQHRVEEARGVFAATATWARVVSQNLSTYIDATVSGAGRAVVWLERVKTTAEITEMFLTGAELAVAVEGEAAVGVAAEEIDQLAAKTAKEYATKAGISEAELAEVRLVKGPPGNTGRGVTSTTKMGKH